ncbi:hypothetical protein F4860DRAFT_463173 [Xylaria cubensis]|nr:hypothetical protein F4860DRAFT_463173 [Xylaria cubensis]
MFELLRWLLLSQSLSLSVSTITHRLITRVLYAILCAVFFFFLLSATSYIIPFAPVFLYPGCWICEWVFLVYKRNGNQAVLRTMLKKRGKKMIGRT